MQKGRCAVNRDPRDEAVGIDVTVTIANWNRSDLLRQCLASLSHSERTVSSEIIVVDNASTDDSVTMMRRDFPEVRLVVNERNRGFGPAHNQAIRLARGRYVLVLNNDAAVLPTTMPTLVEFMNRHEDTGICSCPARSEDDPLWLTGGGMRAFPTVARDMWQGVLELAVPPLGLGQKQVIAPASRWLSGTLSSDRDEEVAWVRGALFLIRRSMLEQIGLFDEQFFMYYEETDLCLRARMAGWRVWCVASTSYIHEGGGSTALRRDREQLFAASGAAYYRKHRGRLHELAFVLQNAILRRGLLRVRRSATAALRRRFAKGAV